MRSLSTVGVIGATGTAGSRVVARLRARDVAVVEISRAHGVDLVSGQGCPARWRVSTSEIVLDGPVPATIVRSTQWYEFATHPAAVTCDDGEVVVQDWLIQPIAADTVADVLVEAALGQTHPPRTITGPQTIRLPELTSKLLAQQGDSRRVRAAQPALGALATGALLASGQAIVIGPDVDTWLHTLAPADTDGGSAGEAATPPR
ncbi:NmrA family protein [Mycobacterium heidelbergense]|uniref:Uncharacterized protein n=1 Tax=Mycobacterium heidelbergense TaxID=53376 RepID=A0A1X0DPW8_MYCHE|nr:hypothetical protein [Mycobacterium heidelbergense]MCV7053246.1 NmrA family protein [Mycobacterium heidelbergense]ORA74357.1 hypothetical protein BST25_09950 [Mycobacterium heidelbergense]BBZ49040.1 hypothetical protein MHEI_07570 [Mycobacterium heidelbergense]